MSEVEQITALARAWIRDVNGAGQVKRSVNGAQEASDLDVAPDDISEDTRSALRAADLFSISAEVRDLLSAEVGCAQVLERSSALFDRVAESRVRPDRFGERYELLALFCFLSWRHSSFLGLEVESQQWLRIIEALARERFSWADCLESFLFLPVDEKADNLIPRFLSSLPDVFLALAILRAKRNVNPRGCHDSAVHLYRWIEAKEARVDSREREFILGDLALAAGSAARYIGMRGESYEWLTIARRRFAGADANGPLLARVDLQFSIRLHDLQRHLEVENSSVELLPRLERFGLYRETLLLRLNRAGCLVDSGRDRQAFEELVDIADQTRDADPQLHSACLFYVGQCFQLGGNEESAQHILRDALMSARAAEDPVAVAFASSALGALELQRGNWERSVKWFLGAVALLHQSGAAASLAYLRIYLSEALIAGGRFGEAREQLTLALPIIEHERMVNEGVHALKLLGVVAAHFHDRSLRDFVTEMQERIRS